MNRTPLSGTAATLGGTSNRSDGIGLVRVRAPSFGVRRRNTSGIWNSAALKAFETQDVGAWVIGRENYNVVCAARREVDRGHATTSPRRRRSQPYVLVKGLTREDFAAQVAKENRAIEAR